MKRRHSKTSQLVKWVVALLVGYVLYQMLFTRENFDGVLGSFFTGTMWFIGILLILAVIYSIYKGVSGSSSPPTYVPPV